MSLSSRGAALALVLGALGLAANACTDFKKGDDGVADAGAPGVDGGSPDALALADAGGDAGIVAPPTDDICDEPWTKLNKTKPACQDRRVVVLQKDVEGVNGVSIARTDDGRVAIAFNDTQGGNGPGAKSDLRLALFSSTESVTAPPVTSPFNGGPDTKIGLQRKLVAGPNNVMHMLYTQDGQLRYVRMDPGKTSFSTPEPVASALGPNSQIALGVAPDETVHIAYVKDGAGTLHHVVRKPNGQQSTQLTLDTKFEREIPGNGNLSLYIESDGTPNLAYHQPHPFGIDSAPRHRAFTGQQWTDRHTFDNNVPDGVSGFDVQLALLGQEKRAAYFYWPSGQSISPTHSQLRVAKWSVPFEPDQIQYELLLDKLPTPMVSEQVPRFRFRVAMAQDRAGLLHLAIVVPNGSANTGVLEYKRQTKVPGGVKWISDIVDDDVLGGVDDAASVDLVVDAAFRPHIAYRSGRDRNVYYATRFDR
jgi:hypothetical protein